MQTLSDQLKQWQATQTDITWADKTSSFDLSKAITICSIYLSPHAI